MATTGLNTQPQQQRTQRSIRFGAPMARPAPVARGAGQKPQPQALNGDDVSRPASAVEAPEPPDQSLTEMFMSLADAGQAAHPLVRDTGKPSAAPNLAVPGEGLSSLDDDVALDFAGLSEALADPSAVVSSDVETQVARPAGFPSVPAANAPPGGAATVAAPSLRKSRAERFAPRGDPADSMPETAPSGPVHDVAFTQSQVASLESIRAQGAKTVTDAKKNMAAAKVLTPLVASISFNPGFSGSQAERTQALTGLLKEVHVTAEQTANKISEVCARDVPQWMVTGLMQALSEVVATQWQRTGKLESGVLAESMKIVFGNSENLAHLIENASQAAYHEVKTIDHARDRVTVSTVSAAWRIYDWVTHHQLAVDPKGDSPSVFYTYGLEPMELVNKVLTKCVDEARAFLLDVGDPDLRVAHLQASIGRMTALVGAEYVTQTRNVMTWIANAPTPQAQEERAAMAQAQLETRILPHVFEWARQNFIRIEEGALGAMEVFDEQKNSPKAAGPGVVDGTHSRGSDDAQHGQ